MAEKPSILIFGASGFIGRNLVEYLTTNDLCSKIRGIDPRKPSASFFSEEHKKAFDNPVVEFVQGGAAAHIEKAFKRDEGPFDYVVNLAAETRYGEDELMYQERVLKLGQTIAGEAEKYGIKKYIEVSTAQVYAPSKTSCTEDAKIKPWTPLATYKYKTEQHVVGTKLPYVVLRPAICYGPADARGLMPRIIAGRIYKFLDKKMKCLWDGDLRINTVHVRDVAKAIWTACTKAEAGKIYNVADKGDTSQSKVNKCLEQIFGIQTGYYNKIKCSLAKASFKETQRVVNDKHLNPWVSLLGHHEIEVTPLSPVLPPELLYDNQTRINGSKIESELGFEYDFPEVTKDLLVESMNYAVKQKIFPPMEDK